MSQYRRGQKEALIALAIKQGTLRPVAHSTGPLAITLPLPPAELSPNARCHWARKAGAVKAYRLRAEVECGTRSERHQAATVRIQWYSRTAMHPDPDNSLAKMKAGLDGVTDSGYMADDRALTFLPIEFAKDAGNPRVVLTFTPAGPVADGRACFRGG